MTQSPWGPPDPAAAPQTPPQFVPPSSYPPPGTHPGYSEAPGAYPPAGTYPPSGGYPPNAYPPAGTYPPASPYAPAGMYLAAPPVKKRPGWLIPVIVAVALALVGAGVYVGLTNFGPNSYCRTYAAVGQDLVDLSNQLSEAMLRGDQAAITAALDNAITGFERLKNANPPDTVTPSLTRILNWLDNLQTATSGASPGDMAVVMQLLFGFSDFAAATQSFESASTAYCS